MHSEPLSLRKKIIFSAVVILLFLFFVEVGLRLTFRVFLKLNPYQRYSAAQTTELIPNFRSVDSEGETLIAINQYGFRGPDFQAPKPKDTFRIFVLGDSTVFGMAKESCPYPAQLQEQFNKNGLHVEVVNAGIEGNDSTMAGQRLINHVLKFEPDLVLIAVGWNDLYSRHPSDMTRNTKFRTLSRWLNKLYLVKAYRFVIFRYLHPWLRPPSSTNAESFSAFEPVEFRENLVAMISAIRAKNATAVLMTLPSVLSETPSLAAKNLMHFPYFTTNPQALYRLSVRYNEMIREVATAAGIGPIENATYITSLPNREQFFFDTMHMSCEGNALLAGHIFQELMKLGIMPKP